MPSPAKSAFSAASNFVWFHNASLPSTTVTTWSRVMLKSSKNRLMWACGAISRSAARLTV